MFKKAIKGTRPFRIALDGPSGAGKTYTALMLMHELTGGNFCVMDTERGSASLYSDKFPFDSFEPEDHNPETYIKVIKAAEEGYKGIVIDSLSHAWNGKDGALELVDKAAKRTQAQNTFTAWRDITPLHNKLVDTIINSKIHVIATMRSKMEYVLEEVTRNGKTSKVPRKVGLAPIQRDGMEYEFDLICDMDLDHNLIVSKTRFDTLDGVVLNKPGKDFVDLLRAWLGTTVSAPQTETRKVEPAQTEQDAPAPASVVAPEEDDKALTKEDWNKIHEAAQVNGWTPPAVLKWAAAKYNVKMTSITTGITKWQGREIYAHVKANKPGS